MNINPCSRELVGIQWAWHGSSDFLFLCVVVNGVFFPLRLLIGDQLSIVLKTDRTTS